MFGGTLDGSSVKFPGDKKVLLDLYRKLVDQRIELEDLVVKEPFVSPFGKLNRGDYNPHNKWNTTHGIVHLSAPPNALTAEINLAALATARVLNSNHCLGSEVLNESDLPVGKRPNFFAVNGEGTDRLILL